MKKIVFEKPKNDPYLDRACPKWFNDAKLGIFIHWGPYSVPGWAPVEKGALPAIVDVLMKEGYDIDSINVLLDKAKDVWKPYLKKGQIIKILKLLKQLKGNPYAEWYWNSLAGSKQTKNYHKKVYGNKQYTEFGKEFDEAAKDWNPDTWSKLFSEIGAKYVLITSKHHDGYCLWPSKYQNPKVNNWQASRDLLGDLKDSLDKNDIRLSLYYSAGLDWSLTGVPINQYDMSKSFVHDKEGLEYFDNQVKEIIDRYKPGMIWEDIGYSENGDFNEILDYYYKNVPDGVMNDRAQVANEEIATRHFDYTTTEYFVPQSPREIPWEICRGISGSFGYNRDDNESTTLTAAELVESFADIISKNGNLMLGLGPMADGTMPEHQVKVVKEFGEWVKVNSDAIYGTRPYSRFSDKTLTGNDVRYTTKDNVLNIFVIGKVQGSVDFETLKIKSDAKITLLGAGLVKDNGKGGVVIDKETDEKGCVLQVNLDDISN